MENKVLWHYKPPNSTQYTKFKDEIIKKMRNTFIKTLTKAASKDPKIILVVGDLGFNVVEPFAEKFPARFYNAGVAEQNMATLLQV